MRAALSIIIPTLDAEAALPAALTAMIEGVEAGLVRELILSDGGSKDATCEIGQETGALVVIGTPGRGGQLARGAGAASGEWLLFVHADSWLAPGWAECVRAHITAQATAQSNAGTFQLAFRAPGFGAGFVAGWANLRSRVFGLPYGDQGLLISRHLYDQVGGFEDIPLMEDVAMARALRAQLTLLPLPIHTSAERYLAGGWVRRGARNLWTLARYLGGVPPEKLARRYRL